MADVSSFASDFFFARVIFLEVNSDEWNNKLGVNLQAKIPDGSEFTDKEMLYIFVFFSEMYLHLQGICHSILSAS